VEAFPFNWAAGKGIKTEWEILRAVIYIFKIIYLFSLFFQNICGKIMRFSRFDKICYFLEKFEIFFVSRN
jgi:hypothetical protein